MAILAGADRSAGCFPPRHDVCLIPFVKMIQIDWEGGAGVCRCEKASTGLGAERYLRGLVGFSQTRTDVRFVARMCSGHEVCPYFAVSLLHSGRRARLRF